MPARSMRARAAISRSAASFSSRSLCASLRVMAARVSTSTRAFRSAMSSDSENLANLSFTSGSSRDRPSAATRLSSGTMKPFRFCQLETAVGISHAAWSSAVSFRGGECMMGTGASGGPPGSFLCLNFAGAKGSTGASTMRMTRWEMPSVKPAVSAAGVYRTYVDCSARLSALGFT